MDDELLPARTTAVRLADVALLAWVALWIWAGVTVAGDLRELTSLSQTVTQVGRATNQVGQGLGSLSGLPLVGDQLSAPAQAIQQAGASAVQSGRTSASSIRDASTLIGLAIALIPTVPLVVLLLPRRVAWERERRALRRAERAAGRTPGFEAWLARRADCRLPYHRALEVQDPWRADQTPSPALADAELARFGVRRSK